MSIRIDYRFIIPIFNEADKLNIILKKIKSIGYLDKITFVNDASTDNSKSILEEWKNLENIEILHLPYNMKKEGAILTALNSSGNVK